ncbi:response regulator transcription factor [Salibacterium halotolerans]|uniref:ABC-2 type transport system ATP-binding protein n=1 Tax=Salibacterium halotolerans TaxID=1884432 RepID=A0A1I5Y4I2_9BACI|nr:response regulator transcription factor [Salibacterium halotolerans]SFQ39115.1 ABC-2 type transport system ATP-binding protein [Salibacterium halotolerans]
MSHFTVNQEDAVHDTLPLFSLTIEDSHAAALHSDSDTQTALLQVLRGHYGLPVFDHMEGLYTRLTVEDNVSFYHKWFGCRVPLPEVLVQFDLQSCAGQTLEHCSVSDMRRIHFAKYYMSGGREMVFREPVHGVDIRTTNTFLHMLHNLKEESVPVLVLVSNMEHAVLLGDVAYKLNQNGLQEVETQEESASESEHNGAPATANLFKIPAKVGDKMILFDPPEIDYIESRDGKAEIVINEESYTMDSTLTEAGSKLEVYGFYRCHRSYIVNLQKVREIITWSKNAYSLRMDNKTQSTIPLSRTKLHDIQDKFSLR